MFRGEKRIFLFALTFILVAISSLSCAEKHEPAPNGFAWQKLELTGGKMLKPADWFFSEKYKPPEGEARYFRWIVSKENAAEK
jgi:hypothetical protein